MTEVRFDPLRRRKIYVAEQRAGRPNDYRARGGEGLAASACPFCPGNEHETPPEIAAERPAESERNDSQWTLRVVPNRYPALMRAAPPPSEFPGFVVDRAFGAHEVIIESRDHGARLERLPPQQIGSYLRHLQARARAHRAAGFDHVMMFRNCGAYSGASLIHPHTQLLADPQPSNSLAQELEAIAEHYARTQRCLVCDVVASELADGRRILTESDGLISLVPFAARFGAETWILPRSHAAPYDRPFCELEPAVLDSIGARLQQALRRVLAAFGEPSYNLILEAWVADDAARPPAHWRIEIVPRLATVGGYELGSGDFIGSRTPEEAAQRLREASP